MIQEKWEKHFKILEEYYKEHGDIRISQSTIINGIKIGLWLYNQKISMINNTTGLNDYEKDLLFNKYGFSLELKKKKKFSFDTYYEALVKYKKEYGNCNVPVDYVVDELNLGFWLHNQCASYRGIGTVKKNEEHIKMLKDLGVSFNRKSDKWMMKYLLCKKYLKTGKIANDTVFKGINIGTWLSTQRRLYLEGKLIDSRRKLLERLNITLEDPILLAEDKWLTGYKHLMDYKKVHGNTNVPRSYKTKDGYKLGTWLMTQKNNYRSGKLREDRKKLLIELEIDWNMNDTEFLNEEITSYKEYKIILLKRAKEVLEDLLVLDDYVITEDNQEEIKEEIVKRIWR